MKKVGWPMLYIFLLKPSKQWSFENFKFFFVEYFHKKMIVFQWKQFKIKFTGRPRGEGIEFLSIFTACVCSKPSPVL